VTDLREQIEAVIRATIFHSTAYSWYGRRSPRLSPRIRRALTPLTQRNYLVFQLQSQLYRDFYCQAMASPAREQGGGLAAAGTTHFVQALSDANCGEGYWDDGWSVSALDRDFVVARNGRLELQAGFEQCRVAGEGDLQLGTRVYLRYPKEFRSFSPGFYMASSNRPPIDDTPGSIVRVYWNIAAEGAVRFLCSATSLLNGAGLAFRLKVVNDPTLYTRCDAAVLYFHRDDYPLVARLLPELYAGAATNLKQGTPAFTKCLWGASAWRRTRARVPALGFTAAGSWQRAFSVRTTTGRRP